MYALVIFVAKSQSKVGANFKRDYKLILQHIKLLLIENRENDDNGPVFNSTFQRTYEIVIS